MKHTMSKIILMLCAAAVGFSGWQLYRYYSDIRSASDSVSNVIAPVKAETEVLTSPVSYTEMSAKYEDYRGWIWFSSDLISLPIVQGNDNYTYLQNNLDQEKSLGGIPLMDAADSLTDQNITIYGHAVFTEDSSLVFTPLQQLVNQDTYSKNKRFFIDWAEGIKTYEIYAVCNIDRSSDDWNYTQNVFQTDQDFYAFIHNAKDRSAIYSDIDIAATDHLIALQTCTELDSAERTVVFAKEL
jgi:sortase B